MIRLSSFSLYVEEKKRKDEKARYSARKRTSLNYIAKRTSVNITIDYDDIANIEEIASVLIGLVVHANWLIDSRHSCHSRVFIVETLQRLSFVSCAVYL